MFFTPMSPWTLHDVNSKSRDVTYDFMTQSALDGLWIVLMFEVVFGTLVVTEGLIT